MFRNVAVGVAILACGLRPLAAETLREVLKAASIPVQAFSAADLDTTVINYAVNNEEPFLLAYYKDGLPPLEVIRYERATLDLKRTSLKDIEALFRDDLWLNCMGSAMAIRED